MGLSVFVFSCVFFLFCIGASCLFFSSVASNITTQYSIYPNFTASFLGYIDNKGAFLFSPNRTFEASLSSLESQTNSLYFFVTHVPSNAIVWTANRNTPISSSGKLYLTADGITITESSSAAKWSTPPLVSRVSVLQLRDSGNLVLLDGNGNSLWESLEYPTDTIVMGQRLAVGTRLDSSVATNNLSSGDYQFMVTDDDAVLQWNGMTYWKLSLQTMAYKQSNAQVSFLSVNSSGFYLFASDGSTVVVQVNLAHSDFRIAKLESNGQFTVKSIADDDQSVVSEFVGPYDDCQIPFICGKLGLCINITCLCSPGFHSSSQLDGGCVPQDKSLSLPSACNGDHETALESESTSVSYIELDGGIDYFSNNFVEPVELGSSLLVCQDLCSRNCSCLGLFHDNSSGSCYFLRTHLGSFMSIPTNEMNPHCLGYIKAIAASTNTVDNKDKKKEHKFPTKSLMLIPASGVSLLAVLLVVIGIRRWRRKQLSRKTLTKVSSTNNSYSSELDIISIPGLHVKY